MTAITKISVSILLLVQISCSNSVTTADEQLTDHPEIQNQGVHIDYEDNMTGDTVLLFIHGWNINKTYWKDQTAFFKNRYRVISLDLPGFGKSGSNRSDWSVDAFAKDVTSVLTQLDLKKVVLIGHSMSGAIALEAALTHSSRVIGLVGVDNFTNFGAIPSPQDSQDIAAAYAALRTNYKQTAAQYASQYLFSPTTDTVVRKRVMDDFMNADSIISVDCLEQNDKYPIDRKLGEFTKVLYLINSNLRGTDTAAFKKSSIDVRLLNIGPTGHYPMIEKPDDFNGLLSWAINDMGRSAK